MNAAEGAHPAELLPGTRALAFVCPACKGALEVREGGYRCAPCDRRYELHGGIPDFRLFDDPYLDRDADRVRTDIVLDALPRMAMPELLAHYWSFSAVTPRSLRAKFIESALRGDGRARRLVSVMERRAPDVARPGARLLELGSGTGNLLSAAAAQGMLATGSDIAMRWLHVARRRFLEEGREAPPLVCCCAEHLPFPDASFDAVASLSTLQFLRDPALALAECARVLRPGGAAVVNTVNRWSLAPEPHVGLWGLGFLPHALQVRYVRLRRGAIYEIRNLSRPALTRAARASFGDVRFDLGDVDDAALATLPRGKQAQVRLYRALVRLPVTRQLLGLFGPEWDVTLREPRPAALSRRS